MKYRVQVLPRADADLRRMAAYLHERSKQGAAAWLNAFQKARRRLAESADTIAECRDGGGFDCKVREISFKTRRGLIYRIIFTIVDSEVRILRVRGPGQAPIDPSELTGP